MIKFSHRDRRVSRDLARSAGGILLIAVGLVGVGYAAPWPALRFGAVVGLAGAGGFFLWQIDRTVGRYLADLAAVESGGGTPGSVRVEVESDVGLEDRPEVPTPPSPGTRTTRRRGSLSDDPSERSPELGGP